MHLSHACTSVFDGLVSCCHATIQLGIRVKELQNIVKGLLHLLCGVS